MKKIKLTKNQFALVDDEDFEFLNQWKWQANKSRDTFYAQRSDNKNGKQKHIFMHRLLLPCENTMVDHINRNGLDNQKHNLRTCNHSQNAANAKFRKKYKGTYLVKGKNKFRASIMQNNKTYRLGYFKTEIDAAKAYDKKAKELYGEFASLNFE